ncbi:MAG TPA: hypothetical protein VHX17_07710 [Candidatus Cybelea sp.]|jgi:hypothetical protein|nr:hypothetical protein [Candidatus Cybelea sp.]
MSESFRTSSADQPWSSSPRPGNGQQSAFGELPPRDDEDAGEAGKIVLAGVLGGLLSAAGYMIYRRLPDEQRERLHSQVRTLVAQRITELRQSFNI